MPELRQNFFTKEWVIIATERAKINELHRRGTLKDEARRRIERELDLREAELLNKRSAEGDAAA